MSIVLYLLCINLYIPSIPGHAGGQRYDPQPPDPIVVTYELYEVEPPPPPSPQNSRGPCPAMSPPRHFSRIATTTSLTFQIPSSAGENNVDISLKWKRRRGGGVRKKDTKKGTSFFLSCHRQRGTIIWQKRRRNKGGFREACFVG